MYILEDMNTKLSKWGNSYAIRIPKEVIDRLSISEGTEMDVSVSTDGFIVKTKNDTYDLSKRKIPNLKKLIDKITPENRHEVVDWGKPVGKEIW